MKRPGPIGSWRSLREANRPQKLPAHGAASSSAHHSETAPCEMTRLSFRDQVAVPRMCPAVILLTFLVLWKRMMMQKIAFTEQDSRAAELRDQRVAKRNTRRGLSAQ